MKRLFAVFMLAAASAACAPLARQPQVLPTPRPTVVQAVASDTTDVIAEQPTNVPTPAQTAVEATEAVELPPVEPVVVSDSALAGDPVLGEELFKQGRGEAVACAGCHNSDSDARLMGPGLLTVAERAETRVDGMSAEDYLHESIVDPSAFVVRSFFNMMPSNFGTVYSDEEIDALVAYLMTLDQGEDVRVAAAGTAG